VISHSRTLEYLEIQGIDLSSEGLLAMSNGFKQNLSLKTLIFDCVQMTTSDHNLITHCIDHLPLTRLAFTDCFLDDYCIPAIDFLL
jgi:hypothetical protein